MKLALSMLCENPHRQTGLSTLFHEFVKHALVEHPDVKWVVFAGAEQPWAVEDARVEIVRAFPSNERRLARLGADHLRVAAAARARGAEALLTVGFVPLRMAGLPVVIHVFTVHHQRGGGLGAWYRRAMVKRGLSLARLLIANSHWTVSQLGTRRSKVLVSYEGLQHERFTPQGPRGLDGVAGGYLLWVGNFYRYKRAELALGAYARLRPELRARFPFWLVGGDWNAGRERAEAAARELGVERDVKFLGWVKDDQLPALYRGARAHVLSTSEETFGRSVAEAMACGCPCVLQDLPVLREVTAGAAEFVDYADAVAAGAALERLCTDEARHAQLQTLGLARARDFSFAKLARERVAAIKEVLCRP